MHSIKSLLTFLSVILILSSCSSNDEGFQPVTENPTLQSDIEIPMEPLANIGAVVIEGYPKMIRKYENGILTYWAHYYFRPDGQILKLNMGLSPQEKYTLTYQYDSEGNIVKYVAGDEFDFFWDKGRIIKVAGNNPAWHGRYDIYYNYNDQGQVIQKLEIYLNTTPITRIKTNYSYFTDGNIESIESYVDSKGNDTYEHFFKTNFANYVEQKNLFLSLEIIPGQPDLQQFPGSKDFKLFLSSGYDFYETYDYKFDTRGRVIEKLYGNKKDIYEYY